MAVLMLALIPLPDPVLLQVLDLLELDDVVTAGQVCLRWRLLARNEGVWRRRTLRVLSFCAGAGVGVGGDLKSARRSLLDAWVCDTPRERRRFVRVIRAAPCLGALDVSAVCWSRPGERRGEKQALLRSNCKVSRLSGVECAWDGGWVSLLLGRLAPWLEELAVSRADPEALAAIREMPRLKSLSISQCADVPDDADDAVAGPGLQFLSLDGLPRHLVRALLRANRDSLREVRLAAGTQGSRLGCCNDLEEVLGVLVDEEADEDKDQDHLDDDDDEVEPVQVVLVRRTEAAEPCEHSLSACAAQLKRLNERINEYPRSRSPPARPQQHDDAWSRYRRRHRDSWGRAGRTVRVRCHQCELWAQWL